MFKAILQSDEMTDELKEDYVQIESGTHAGKYRLVVEAVDGFDLQNVEGLTDSNRDLITKRTTLQDEVTAKANELAPFKELGKSIDELKSALTIAGGVDADRAEFERTLRTELDTAHAERETALQGERDTERDRRFELMKRISANEGLEASKCRDVSLYRGQVLDAMDMVSVEGAEGGAPFDEIRFKGADNKHLYSKKDDRVGKFMLSDEFVELVTKVQHPLGFPGSEAVGLGAAGTKPGAGGGANGYAGANPWVKTSIDVTERSRIMKTQPELGNRLKAAAKVENERLEVEAQAARR